MAVGETEVVTALVAGGGKAGKWLLVVHRHQKPGIVDTHFILVHHHPEGGGSHHGGFTFLHESLVTRLFEFHVAAANPAIH